VLVDHLWPERSAEACRSSLYSLISRLRGALQKAGLPKALVRMPSTGAYRLDVDPDTVDFHRFRRLLAAARDAGRNGYHESCVALLDDALAIWRDEPLADLHGAHAEHLRRAMEDALLSAYKCLAESKLQIAEYDSTLAILEPILPRHDLDETLAQYWIAALSAIGRESDARAFFTIFRQRFRRSMRTERSIDYPHLAGHPGVLGGGAGPAGRSTRINGPRQLPSDIADFTGHPELLSELDALIDPTGPALRVIVLSGMPGVGKTTLALAWAQRVGARFPDGQLYANLRGHDPGPPAKPSEVLNGFLRALNPGFANPPTVPERAALFRSLVNGRRVLVVLDNAASADQVRPLLPGSPSCLVVVTSRAYLTGLATDYGAARVDLGLLPPPDAVSLLRTVIGHERVTAEPEAVGQVARLCGRLPLALHLAGQRAALRPDIPLGELAAELADETRRLDVLTIGTDVSTAVRRVFQWSYRSLGHPQARMFGLVGLHPGAEISVLAAAALAGVPPTAARRLLDDLTDARLVDQAGRHRYRMHDLLRIYARERAESAFGDTERAQAVRRLVEFYLHAASLADRALHPGRRAGRGEELNQPGHPVAFSGYDEALRWCETERTNLVAITRLAAGTGLPAAAWQLPDTLWSYFFLSKHWTDWAAACRTGLEAARHAGDLTGQSRMLTGLASVHRDLRHSTRRWIGTGRPSTCSAGSATAGGRACR